MSQHTAKFNQFRLLVNILGLTTLTVAATMMPWRVDGLPLLAVFLILIFLSEVWPIEAPGSPVEFAMTTPIVVSAFLSLGPPATVFVAFLGVLSAAFWLHARELSRHGIVYMLSLVVMNTSIYILSVLAASLAFLACGGKTLAQSDAITFSGTVMPLLVWVMCWTTTDMLLFTTGYALAMKESWSMHLRQNLVWYIPNYVVVGPAGILFAMIWSEKGILGILLIIIPFIVGRQALNQRAIQLDTYRETVTTLGSYMQHYHPYTKGHLERVADLADAIARDMCLPPASLLHIREAGVLHDIGKVGVNEDVLNKIGKLTDEEWGIIKEHPRRGAEILAQMKYLEPIVPWVRAHHERPDGRGYPYNLQNSEIPLEASVISVADAFDAMTGGPEDKDKRVYRTPLTIDQAVDQVRQGAGTQFDERVVMSFLRVMARKES